MAFLLLQGGSYLLLQGAGRLLLDPLDTLVPSVGAFDAGAINGFGKWFNLAYGTTSSSRRRPKRRDTDVGRLLDELVYGEEDRAALAALPGPQKAAADKIVEQAATKINDYGHLVQSAAEARRLLAEHERRYARAVSRTISEARPLMLVQMAENSRKSKMVRIARDDADILVLAML